MRNRKCVKETYMSTLVQRSVVRLSGMLVLIALLLTKTSVGAVASSDNITVPLRSVNGSGVTGLANLKQMVGGGTYITVGAEGLTPRVKYVSLYSSNNVCTLEPYAQHDQIGGG